MLRPLCKKAPKLPTANRAFLAVKLCTLKLATTPLPFLPAVRAMPSVQSAGRNLSYARTWPFTLSASLTPPLFPSKLIRPLTLGNRRLRRAPYAPVERAIMFDRLELSHTPIRTWVPPLPIDGQIRIRLRQARGAVLTQKLFRTLP